MANSKQIINRKNLKERIAELSREQLLKLLTELLNDAPEMGDWLAAFPVPDASARPKTTQTKPVRKVDEESAPIFPNGGGVKSCWPGDHKARERTGVAMPRISCQ